MECSMCGDVGFAEHLFQCSECTFRFQHTYCSRGYFYGDHIELCDWCFLESHQSGGSGTNFHSKTKSQSILTKNVDGKRSNASDSLRRKSANALSLKRKGDELTISVSKTKVQDARLAPPRSKQRMKLLHEILC